MVKITDEMIIAAREAIRRHNPKTDWPTVVEINGQARAAIEAALNAAEPVAYTSRDFLERLRDNPCEMFTIASQGTFSPDKEVPLYATFDT